MLFFLLTPASADLIALPTRETPVVCPAGSDGAPCNISPEKMGFCKKELCVAEAPPKPPIPPAKTKKTSSGCSVGSTGMLASGSVFGSLALLAIGRRRD